MRKDSEEYRHLCECLTILGMPFPQRRPYIERIAKVRGEGAADHIRLTLTSTPREVIDTLKAGAE